MQNFDKRFLKEYYKDGFYGFADALKQCIEEGSKPLYMPDIIRLRIVQEDDIWQKWWQTPSIAITGKGKSSNFSKKGGTHVIVYAHVPNYLSEPSNIRKLIKNGTENGAVPIPYEEFKRLLDMFDNKNVFVFDYKVLSKHPNGIIPFEEAIKHPQLIAFAGDKDVAEAYLEMHKKVYKETNIGIWYPTNLTDTPLGRALLLGNYFGRGLDAADEMDGEGRILGYFGK